MTCWMPRRAVRVAHRVGQQARDELDALARRRRPPGGGVAVPCGAASSAPAASSASQSAARQRASRPPPQYRCGTGARRGRPAARAGPCRCSRCQPPVTGRRAARRSGPRARRAASSCGPSTGPSDRVGEPRPGDVHDRRAGAVDPCRRGRGPGATSRPCARPRAGAASARARARRRRAAQQDAASVGVSATERRSCVAAAFIAQVTDARSCLPLRRAELRLSRSTRCDRAVGPVVVGRAEAAARACCSS